MCITILTSSNHVIIELESSKQNLTRCESSNFNISSVQDAVSLAILHVSLWHEKWSIEYEGIGHYIHCHIQNITFLSIADNHDMDVAAPR